jgi:hypothetical protein
MEQVGDLEFVNDALDIHRLASIHRSTSQHSDS